MTNTVKTETKEIMEKTKTKTKLRTENTRIEDLKKLMSNQLTNIREQVGRKLDVLETRMNVLLYDVDRQRPVRHAELDGFHTKTVKQLDKVAQRLSMHGPNIKGFDDESSEESTVFNRRKMTMERRTNDQSKDLENEEDEDVNTDDRSTKGEKRKSNRKSKTKNRHPEEPFEHSNSSS